jgi:cellulose synthase/poly-beta-1,6-N-acetylglucosamine synthase-like glycosyltransferase
MTVAAQIFFWGCVALLAYVYAGFALLVALWAVWRGRPVHQRSIAPAVSLVVAAYNEARGIAAKLDNALALDYPRDKLEILVASDGSDDGTEKIVAGYADRGVQLLALPRRGKLHALDAAIDRAHGEILVFSDANTYFDPQAVRMLARNFADLSVGGVCGNQRHRRDTGRDSSGEGEKLYWSYDKSLKALESRTGSIVSADGAIYAIRRSLYRKPASAAVTDDFAISTAVIEQGARLVYEPAAVAYEDAVGDARGEFGRKVRIMTRGWYGVLLRRRLLDPRRYGFYAVVLWSHKVLRRLSPLFLLALFAAGLVAANSGPVYATAAVAQAGLYALAFAGWALKRSRAGRRGVLYAPFFFVLANAAALVALSRLVRGQRVERWQPQRPAPDAPVPTR